MAERLQKWLAAQGLGSRRQAEVWIAAGRITIDGAVATLGQKVSGDERITLDGRVLRGSSARRQPKVLMYHKPAGEICTRNDPQGRPTVFDGLPRLARGRWIGVGRLDLQTAGLLLVSNDGELVHRLMHPSTGLPREYAVRVLGEVDAGTLRRLRAGVKLEDGPACFDAIDFDGGEGSNRWYKVTVHEGRNRLVRRLWEAVGHRVSRLIRVRYGPISMPRDLRTGKSRFLDAVQMQRLYESAGLQEPS